MWTATALANQPASPVPNDYQYPALSWLRGGAMDLLAPDGRLSLHGDFIMPVETRAAPGFQLPSLPFLGKQPAKAKPKPSAAPKGGAKPELLPEPRPKSRREF